MKKRRHAKILELISSKNIETQEELQAYLLKCGFEVTQATISRDIKELRLVKELNDKGRYIYSTGKKHQTMLSEEQAEYLQIQSLRLSMHRILCQ